MGAKSYTYHERSRLITPDDPTEAPRRATGWAILWIAVIAVVVIGFLAMCVRGPVRAGFQPPHQYVDPARIGR